MAERELAGMKELNDKLEKLARNTGEKVLRQSLHNSSVPVLRALRLSVPVGSTEHRTYKGRLVNAGFAKKSIRAKSFVRRGKGIAMVRIGVAKEAFYAVTFVEHGTAKMPAQPWFVDTFVNKQSEILKRFSDQMKTKIEQAAR